MTSSRDPLERHDLRSLEQASEQLQSHIRQRRGAKSRVRKALSLSIGVGLTIIGAYLIVANIQAGRFMGMPSWFGVSMFVTGLMIVYSDFAEG